MTIEQTACTVCNQIKNVSIWLVKEKYDGKYVCPGCIHQAKTREKWLPHIINDVVGDVPIKQGEVVTVICRSCKQPYKNRLVTLLRLVGRERFIVCRTCVMQLPEVKAKLKINQEAQVGKPGRPLTQEQKNHLAKKIADKWKDPEYRDMKMQQIHEQWADEEFKKRHFEASMAVQDQRTISMTATMNTEETKAKKAASSIKLWQDEVYKNNVLKSFTPERLQKISEDGTAYQALPGTFQKQKEAAEKIWRDPEYRAKVELSEGDILSTIDQTKFKYIERVVYTGWADPRYLYVLECLSCGRHISRHSSKLHHQCSKCFDPNAHLTQSSIAKWVLQFADDVVEDFDLEKQEIDIYSKQRQFGIEYCGLFWHRENAWDYKEPNYHLNKLEVALRNGISLITVFEDEWLHKQTAVECYIKFKLDVGVSDVEVEKIGERLTTNFYDDFHISPPTEKQTHMRGFFLCGEIIGVMSSSETNILNVCFKHGVLEVSLREAFKSIVATASSSITAWSDRRYDEGELFEKLGFKLEEVFPPGFMYVKFQGPNKSKYLRYHEPTVDVENCDRIWDCGKKKWVFTP